MATPGPSSIDLPIQNLGGRCTQFDPMTLPIGASPFNEDVIYSGKSPDGEGLVAGVATRPGMSPFYAAPFAGNPTVNYIKTFIDSTGTNHLISLDNLGVVRDETPNPVPPNVPATIGNAVAASIAQSDSLLNREWIAISDALETGFGIDIPRQWDATYFDRVSQSGPGSLAGVIVGDISVPITAIARVTGPPAIITVTAAGHGLVPGDIVNIAGVTADPSLNGQWPVATVAGTTFTAWGAPAQFAIGFISRAGGTVTATFGLAPIAAPGNTIIVANVLDPSFNGVFVVGTVAGNQVTWPQAGTVATSFDGIMYVSEITLSMVGAFTPIGGDNIYEIVFNLQQGQVNPFFIPSIAVVAGSSDAGWNATPQNVIGFNPRGVPAPGTFAIQVEPGSPNEAIGGTVTLTVANSSPAVTGSVGIAGSIPAGLIQVSVSYVTREEYITKPAPWIQWYAQGGFQVSLTNLPLGPPNIIQRIIMFTSVIVPPALTGDFFYFDGSVQTATAGTYPSMVITDNTTTTFTGNFDISSLQLGTEGTSLFDLVVLGECANFVSYSNRLFACGERNKVPNLLNMDFDGGYSPTAPNVPLGWTLDPVLGTGNSLSTNPAVWAHSYAVTSAAGVPVNGKIFQSAFQDYLGVAIISPATAYSLRFRLAQVGADSATFFCVISSASTGYTSQVSFGPVAIGTTFLETILAFNNVMPSPIPADLIISIYINWNFPVGGTVVYIENLELYPTNLPYNRTQIRASLAGDPESFDQLTGKLIPGSSTSQSMQCGFTLLDKKLYYVSALGLWVTQDDGQNEPASWDFSQISTTVGTPSVRGVALGESWAVIAAHDGAYIFWGGEPVKITQEIQPDWDGINWNYGTTIYVVVDTVNKRIHIGAPINGATSPNVEFVCDYSQLANAEGATAAEDIASHPQAYYSVYNPTKVVAPGKARKWTLWNITMNCGALTIRSDGSYHLLRGNGTGTGKIYDQLTSQLTDDGAAINDQYQTAYFPQYEDEQVLQLGAGNKHCIYMRGATYGSGILNFIMYGMQNQRAKVLSTLTLTDPAQWDWEKNIDFRAERMSLLFGHTNTPGAWMVMTKLIPTIQKDLSFPVRGSM